MSNSSSPQASFSFTQQQQQYGDYSNVSPQLYTKDELIIKIPGSVQSMSPTRLPPTPTSEASKAVDMSPIVAYDNNSGSPMAISRTPSDNLSPPPSSSSTTWPTAAAAITTTTTEVTAWSSSSNDTPDNNDDIHFAAQGYDSWFDNSNKTSSFNISPAGIPSPQHSTDRLATRSATSTASFTPDDDDDDYNSSHKASSKMYSDHMDDEIRPPTSLISLTTRQPQKNTNNPWSSATLVDSWEGFQPFVQTVKPTPVMKHPKKYRLPDDTLQPLDEEPQKEEIDNNDDPEQQQEEQENDTQQQQQQSLSSGSSDQYEDALSSPTKSEHEAVDQQDNIKMTFDDVELDEPTRNKNKADHVVDDDDDDDSDWVYSREQASTIDTHHVRRYSRDELIDMQPQLEEESILGQGAKQRIDNFISVRQA